MGALPNKAADQAMLAEAWRQAYANDAEDDVLSPGVRRFGDGVERRLQSWPSS